MAGHEVTVAVDDFSAVIDGAAQAGSLAYVEHGVSQTVDMLLEPGIFVDGATRIETGFTRIQVQVVVKAISQVKD